MAAGKVSGGNQTKLGSAVIGAGMVGTVFGTFEGKFSISVSYSFK